MEPAVSGKGFHKSQKVQQTVQGQGRPGGDQGRPWPCEVDPFVGTTFLSN